MMRYSRVGIPYGLYKKKKRLKRTSKKPIDFVNILLFATLFIIFFVYIFFS